MNESRQHPKLPLQIIRDTREQNGFEFAGFPCTVTAGTLEAGDYALAGFERRVAIERKSIQDLVGCLTGERPRFERELQRLKAMDAAAVVVEQPQSVLRLGHFRSRMDAGAAWQSCLALSMRYRIPFWFCDSRADAEAVTFNFLRHFARDRWRELQALRLAPTMTPAATERHRPGAGMDGKPNPPGSRQRAGGIPHPTTTTTGTRP
jgi:ERCC4-type nuclease